MRLINTKFIIVISFLLSYLTVSFSQDAVKSLADNLAGSYLKENKNTGSIVIGLYENGQERIFYYGETEKGNNTLPDSSSIYELGNITETFTSLLFADRTWKGVMRIDDKLQDYLPIDVPAIIYQPVVCRPIDRQTEPESINREGKFGVKFTPYTCTPDSTFRPQPVLLCYLGTHTSGLPYLPDNLHSKNKSNPYSDYSTNDLYDYLRKFELEKEIGFDYKYSPLGIALLGKTIEIKQKMPFEIVLKSFILDSLKMQSTTIILDDNQKKRRVTGYNMKGSKAEFWNSDVFAPVFGLHSTPGDMMIFLRSNISIKKNYYNDLLDYTHNPRIQPGSLFSNDMEIALGWKIIPLQGDARKVVFQNGATGGFASFIGFEETTHKGVFILASTQKNVESIGRQLVQFLVSEK